MTLLCSNLLNPASPSLILSRQNAFSSHLFLRQVKLNVNKGAMKISPIITCSNKKGSGGDKAVKSTFVQKVAKQGDVKFSHEGLVIESLSNGMFRIKLDNEDLITGYLSGKIRRNFVRVLPGDRVKLEISPYDTTKARIVYRIRNKDPTPGS